MYQKDTSKLCIILTNNSFFLKEGDMEDQKIQDLQEELRTILEEKIQYLSQQVRDTEDITRQIITTELQLKNYAEKKQQLQKEYRDLQFILQKNQKELTDLEESLQAANHKNNSVVDLKIKIQNEEKDIFEQEKELQQLHQQSTTNQSKIVSLQEHITRMKEMVDTQMMSVMDLTNELRDITSGNTMVTGKTDK